MKKTRVVALICALLLCALCLCAGAEDAEPETFVSGDYRYRLLEDGTAEITKYTGTAETLTIPDALDGHDVTNIGKYAFAWCESFSSITIPSSVTSIGDHAFSECYGMRSITIPDSVTSIGKDAFILSFKLTLTVGRNSYAAQYCQDNGLPYTYPDALD